MFEGKLVTELTLTIDGTEVSVPAGHIREFELDLRLWGAWGRFVFDFMDDAGVGGEIEDPLIDLFTGTALMEVEFTAISDHVEDILETPPDAVAIKGLVNKRALTETVRGKLGTYRRYAIEIIDPAHHLWGQHRPCELFVDSTVQDVIDAHVGDEITITADWDPLTVTYPVLFLALGTPENEASFYDLLMDFVHRNDGHWLYDATDGTYDLLGEKPGDGEAGRVARETVASTKFRLSEVPRYDVHVLNSNSDDIQDIEITNDDAATGMRQDILMWTPVAADVTDRETLETTRLRAPGHKLEVEFASWAQVTVQPGALVTLEDGMWSTGGLQVGETYRVMKLQLIGRAVEAETDRQWGAEEAGFRCKMAAKLELKDEAVPRLSAFERPRYPARVEGLIVSEQGEETDETWQIYTNSDTSVDQYKVSVPLWEDKLVVADLHPDMLSGHFYFPAYKGQRVWLDLWFDRARIARFIDWRAGARQAQDGQGDALFMGKTETNRTILTHDYADDLPVLTIERRMDKDVGLIKIEEGKLTIRIEEETS